MPVDYSKGKIYKIVDNTNDNIYIGSTSEVYLSKRLVNHRTSYKRFLEGKYNYVSSFNILKNNDYDIILMESYPCDNKNELHARERYYIENNKCVNKIIPGQTEKEHRQKNKEIISTKKKEHYENNKIIYAGRHKQYYENNKEKIFEQMHEKIFCECGSDYCKGSMGRHKKTLKHKKYLQSLNLCIDITL